MSGASEVELKLELEPAAAAAFMALPQLGTRKPRRIAQASVYFDTPKNELRQAGYALRVRAANGRRIQTLKLQAPGAGSLFDRTEWEWRVEEMELDIAALRKTPLAGLLSAKRLKKRLAPLFSVDVGRRVWTLRSGGSEIEVVLDRGEAMLGKLREPICEIELELKRGDAGELFALARSLGEAIPLRLGVRSKAERGYALAVNAPARAAKAEPLLIDGGMKVAESFAAVVHACLRHFRLNEALASERHAGALHQCRVAMRRLRSALTLFRAAVRDEDYDRLRDELRWFTGELGEARNLDVFLTRLPRRRGGKVPKAEAGVRAALVEAREAAYDNVVQALRSPRLRRLILDMVAWTETGAWRSSPRAAASTAGFAEKQLAKRWKRVREGGAQLAALEEEPLHRLRIDIKKLRYATEFFSGLARAEGETARRKQFVAALETLQDELGAINDMATARELILRLSLQSRAEHRLASRLTGGEEDREKHIRAAAPAFARLVELKSSPLADTSR